MPPALVWLISPQAADIEQSYHAGLTTERHCAKIPTMSGKAVDFEHMHQVEALRQRLGDVECRRLGFIADDERGVTVLSTAGLGFLIYLSHEGTQSIAEAFAAGYECAADFHDPEGSDLPS